MKFLNNVDINKNQAISLGLEISSSHPASPVAGQVYFNTSDNLVYVYDGTSWYSLATINDVGLRLYTEQNYVTSGESVTASIDALDVAVASAGRSLLAEIVTEATATEVSFTDLDINAHKSYRIEIETWHNVAGYSCDLKMLVNYDEVQTNYYTQMTVSYGSSSLIQNLNKPDILTTSREDGLSNFPSIATINLMLVNGKPVATSIGTNNINQYVQLRSRGWIYKNTVSNITKITFKSDPVSGIPTGAKFRIYRGDV